MSFEKLKTQFNNSSIFVPKQDLLLTGIEAIDENIKIPVGSVTEIYGDPSIGKTTTLYKIIANLQKQDIICIYSDFDCLYNSERATSIGLDESKLMISATKNKDAINIVTEVVSNMNNTIILMDSISNAVSANPNLNTDLIRLWKTIKDTNNTLIITNQVRGGYKGQKTPLNGIMKKICTNRIQLSHNHIRNNKHSNIMRIGARLIHGDYFYIDDTFEYDIIL